MAAGDDFSRYLSTPAGYATPEQLAAAREYAAYLQHGKGQQPVKHWSQGVSNVVSALTGGWLATEQNAKQQMALRDAASSVMPQMPGETPATGPQMGAGAPKAVAYAPPEGGGNNDPLAQYGRATAKLESGGRYDARGPIVTRKDGSTDRAYGKYQVMGANIGPWSEKHMGQRMSVDEFLASPEAQDAIYKGEMGGYMQKYGNPQDAASMWFTGVPYARAKAEGRRDVNMGVEDYVSKFVNALGGEGGGQAMAFNGQPAAKSEAVDTVNALAGGGQQVAQAGSGGPPVGQPVQYIPPEVVPYRPRYSRQQVMAVQANPYISPEQKKAIMEAYIQQDMPISVDYKGMGKVLVSGQDRTKQFFNPDLIKGTEEVGGIKTPVYDAFNPATNQIERRYGNPAGVAPPARAAQAPPAPTTPMPQGAGGAATPTRTTGPGGAPAAPGVPPGQTAKVPTWRSYVDEAPRPKPYGSEGQPIYPQTGTMADKARYANELEIWKKEQESLASKDAEGYTKWIDNMREAAKLVRNLEPQLKVTKSVIEDPKTMQGFAAKPLNELNKLALQFQEKTGINLGLDPTRPARQELLVKLLAGQTLESLRTFLPAGSGQIRVSEINLVQQALGSPNLTPQGNRAVVEMVQKINDRTRDTWDMGLAYKQKYGKLDSGFDQALEKFDREHPVFSEEEIKKYTDMFNIPVQATNDGNAVLETDPGMGGTPAEISPNAGWKIERAR